jgi:hypothetical protein
VPELRELLIGLATAAISFLLGYAWRRGRQVYRTRRARRFWRPMINKRTVVVLSRFKTFSDFEPSGVIGAGDTRALQELTTYYNDIGLDAPLITYDGSLTGDQLRNDLILLGGPDSNGITKLVLDKLAGSLSVVPGATEIRDADVPLRPRIEGAEVVSDCGAVLRVTSPFWPDNKIVIAAGGFGFGTWAAIRLTRQDDFLLRSKELDDFECSFEVDVVLATPQRVRIRSLRPVSDGGVGQRPDSEPA